MQRNLTSWHVCLTIVAMATQQCALCIVDLHVAFNNIETLSVVMETQQ
jgi:hypothetical protein